MVRRQQKNKVSLSFAQRLRDRRKELGMTRLDLKDKISQLKKQKVSMETIRNMERENPAYRLPKIRPTGEMTPIESIAHILGVPVGYLLGGFSKAEVQSSCFASQIATGKLVLSDTLRTDVEAEKLADFLSSLPDSEKQLLRLPLHSYRNERAFVVIFRIEKIFCGLEMLIVNEPPLIFWDDEDVSFWSRNMGLDDVNADVFHVEFKQYREHFRGLAKGNKKKYRVVLNRPTFVKWLRRKTKESRRQQINVMEEFMSLPNFELLFLNLDKKDGGPVDENQIICKLREIPDTMEHTLAIQILQTPPDHHQVEYFLTPIPPNKLLLQTEKSKFDFAWAAALDEARRCLPAVTYASPISTVSSKNLRRISLEVDAV